MPRMNAILIEYMAIAILTVCAAVLLGAVAQAAWRAWKGRE